MRETVKNYEEAKKFINKAHEEGKAVYQDLEFYHVVLTTEPQISKNLYENGGCMKEVKTTADVEF